MPDHARVKTVCQKDLRIAKLKRTRGVLYRLSQSVELANDRDLSCLWYKLGSRVVLFVDSSALPHYQSCSSPLGGFQSDSIQR